MNVLLQEDSNLFEHVTPSDIAWGVTTYINNKDFWDNKCIESVGNEGHQDAVEVGSVPKSPQPNKKAKANSPKRTSPRRVASGNGGGSLPEHRRRGPHQQQL